MILKGQYAFYDEHGNMIAHGPNLKMAYDRARLHRPDGRLVVEYISVDGEVATFEQLQLFDDTEFMVNVSGASEDL